MTVVKSPSEDGILAVTGATISSVAVTGSVERGLALLTSTVGIGGEVPAEDAGDEASPTDETAGGDEAAESGDTAEGGE